MIGDVGDALNNAHRAGANILFEGAQGTLLDVDHGTYPYVTSSNCVAGNAAAGSGVGPDLLHYILGITKAYSHARRRRAVPDRAADGRAGHRRPPPVDGRARSAARSPAAPAAAAGSTRRCSSARSSSTASRACASPSSTCSTAWPRSRSASATSSRRAHRHPAAGRRRHRALRAGLRDLPGLEREHLGRHPVGRAAGQRAPLPAAHRELTGAPIHMVSTSPDRDHTIMMRHPYQTGSATPAAAAGLALAREERMLTEDGKHLYVS